MLSTAVQEILDSGQLTSHDLGRQLAESSLANFVRVMWPYIDPAPYRHNWHIDLICSKLEAVSKGEIRRLIINVPPRSAKSTLVTVMWPAWAWAQERRRGMPHMGPQVQWMFASYAHALSIRDSVKCRRLMQSRLYQSYFGDRFELVADQNTKVRFDNLAGGYRIATSVDGVLTGEGASVIVLDDPNSVREAESETVREGVLQWWDEAMQTRLNDPRTGAFVVIQQRVHERDLTGHILKKQGDVPWEIVCLPARFEHDHPHRSSSDIRTRDGDLLWPERMGVEEIRAIEAALGTYAANSQLQQRPSPREGGMFKRHWFRVVPEAPRNARRVRAWDLASTEAAMRPNPDWTVGIKMCRAPDGMIYIEDMIRLRDSPMAVERALRAVAEQDGYLCKVRLPQDPGQAGKAQVAYLTKALAGFNTTALPVTGAKDQRASPLASQAEAGNVALVQGDWNENFLLEMASFPSGAHDDVIDAASDAFNTLFQRHDSVLDHL